MQEQSFFLWKRTDEIKYDQNEKKKNIKLAGWSFEKTQDSIRILSLEWKVAHQIGILTIPNSFLCQHEKQSGIVFI